MKKIENYEKMNLNNSLNNMDLMKNNLAFQIEEENEKFELLFLNENFKKAQKTALLIEKLEEQKLILESDIKIIQGSFNSFEFQLNLLVMKVNNHFINYLNLKNNSHYVREDLRQEGLMSILSNLELFTNLKNNFEINQNFEKIEEKLFFQTYKEVAKATRNFLNVSLKRELKEESEVLNNISIVSKNETIDLITLKEKLNLVAEKFNLNEIDKMTLSILLEKGKVKNSHLIKVDKVLKHPNGSKEIVKVDY